MFSEIKKRELTSEEKGELNRQILFSFLSALFGELRGMIYGYWKRVARSKKVKVTTCNMFQKYNLRDLVRTLSDRRELLSRGNMPDMSRIYITEGWLFELPQTPVYTYCDGRLRVEWDKRIWREESSPDDEAVIVCVYLPIDVKSRPRIWEGMRVWKSLDSGRVKRGDGEFEFEIGKGVDIDFLFVWLFFRNSSTCSWSHFCKRGCPSER